MQDDREGLGAGKTLLLILLGFVSLAAGWHYWCHRALETSLTEAANDYLEETLRNATSSVQINPLSNLVLIHVKRTQRSPGGLMELIGDVMIEDVRRELEPQLERELSVDARARMDIFAMLLPYQVSISVEETQGASTMDSSRIKAGWSDSKVSTFVAGCVEGVVAPAKRDFEAAAERAGNTGADFPEKELRASVGQMCSCVSQRIAESWHFDEFSQNQQALVEPLLNEAMSGGRCKPAGLLAEVLGHAERN